MRTCTDPINRDKRLKELKTSLLERGYSELIINSAIDRARSVPRKLALRKSKTKKKTKGPIFVHTYDPRLPAITQIQSKHYRTMVSRDRYLAEVFNRPPVTAF